MTCIKRLILLCMFAGCLIPCRGDETAADGREKVTINGRTLSVLTVPEIHEMGFTDYPDIPRDDNAAYDYIRAMNSMKIPTKKVMPNIKKAFDDFLSGDKKYQWVDGVGLEELIEKNVQTYELLEQAAAKPQCAFPMDSSGQEMMAGMLVPHLSGMRALARLVIARAAYRFYTKDTDGMIKDIQRLYQMIRALDHDVMLIGGLVRVAMLAMTHEFAEKVVLSGSADLATLGRIRTLAAENSKYIPRTEKYIGYEKIFGITTCKQIFKHSGMDMDMYNEILGLRIGGIENIDSDGKAAVGKLFSILYPDRLMIRDMERFYDRLIEIVSLPYLEMVELHGKDFDERLFETIPDWNIIARMLLPALSRTKTAMTKCKAKFSLIQLLCMLREFQLQNKKWPRKLDEIAEASAILDPFTGKGFLYKRSAHGFVLYSAGPNMKDDGGTGKDKDEKGITIKYQYNPKQGELQ